MDILFAATELSPFVKVGGLADVTFALTKTLRQLGHKVTLAMPRFPGLEQGGLLVARRLTPLTFQLGPTSFDVTVYDGRLGTGVELLLLDAPGLFDRPGVFGDNGVDYPDNPLRFGVFSRAIIELLRQRESAGAPFDVVHVHDWPAALVPVYRRELARTGQAPSAPVVLTIHNLADQGICDRSQLPALGLGWDVFHPEYLEFYGKVNLLKGGIVAADRLTTVSVSYAEEIQSKAMGVGLDGVIGNRKEDLVGITNGIDYSIWNPATDSTLVARFDAEDVSNKERCRAAVLHELGLPVGSGSPLVAFVGRMTEPKGVDICRAALQQMVFAGALVVVAGQGDGQSVDELESAVAPFAGQAVLLREPTEPLVHRIFAGADIVLVPSRSEPCGMVQMCAQRYGAVPVAHAVGGLKDTIVDCDADLETGTGFLFEEPTAEGLLGAFGRALSAFSGPMWPVLRRRVMRLDSSWDRPGRRYERVYRMLSTKA